MRLFLFLFAVTQVSSANAQLTADSISNYLTGAWELCEYQNQVYYFDAPDSGTIDYMTEHDEFSLQDSVLTFFGDGTFLVNEAGKRKKYTVDRLLNSHNSPFKLALGKTEFIFEIRNKGFVLERLILGWLDENERHFYSFQRKGMCKHD